MSYSEIRRFTITLTQLGYTKPISMDAFRVPNFNQLADILHFLIMQIVPNAKLSNVVNTVEDRVYFITTAVSLLQSNFCIRLNPKRLYAADINAVRELGKITDEMAAYMNIDPPQTISATFTDLPTMANSLRNQSSELIKKSTDLLLALKQYGDTAPANLQTALTRQPEVRQLQNAVQSRINILEEEIAKYMDELQTNKREKIHMQELLTQKQADLSRMLDRVESMRMTRPPYLIELENAEMELTRIHQEYAKKHRSLSYLESQLRAGEADQRKKKQAKQQSLIAIQDQVHQEEQDQLIAGVRGAVEDQFQNTPNPNKAGIPITNEQIDEEGEYEDEYEEEEEEEESPKAAPIEGFQDSGKKEVNFSDNESIPEDSGSSSIEDATHPASKAPRVPPSKAPEQEASGEYEYEYEEEEEPANDKTD